MLDVAGDGRLFIDVVVQAVLQERLSPPWDGRHPLCRLSSVFAERGLESGRKRGRACHLHIYTVGWVYRPIGMPPRTIRLPPDPKLAAASTSRAIGPAQFGG